MNQTVQSATRYDGRLFKVQVLSYTDDQGRHVQREVVRHPGAVLIVPVLDDQHVLMIRNYRIAVDEQLWEFPAGKLEPGEPPLQAAHRELEEETGYSAKHMSKLGEFYTSPGFANELMHAFVARNLSFVGQRLEAGEEIQVHKVAMNEALDMVRTGKVRDGKSIAGLLMWLDRRQEAAR